MYDPDKYKNKAVRRKPTQARGKERVRIILAAALELFRENGIEDVTTNEIAERADVPIGSLYRYYPNKDTIIVALTELATDDLVKIFSEIGKHPFLKHLSWDEVLLLMADSWVNYSRLNGPFDFLYAVRSNPRLSVLTQSAWDKFVDGFKNVLRQRCSESSERELNIAFGLTLAAAQMGLSEIPEQRQRAIPIHHEAVGIVAAHMLAACNRHDHNRAGN